MGDSLDRALLGVRERTGDSLPPRDVARDERRGELRRADHGEVRIAWIDELEQVHTEIGKLRDSTEKGVGLYTDRRYPTNLAVWLEGAGEGMRKAVVRYSRNLRPERWKTGFLFLQQERRRATRLQAGGPGWLSWGDGIRPAGAPVQVLDISEFGACVEIDDEVQVPRDGMIKLRGEAMECMAAVRYRRPREGKQWLGLQFVCQPYDRARARREAGLDGDESATSD